MSGAAEAPRPLTVAPRRWAWLRDGALIAVGFASLAAAAAVGAALVGGDGGIEPRAAAAGGVGEAVEILLANLSVSGLAFAASAAVAVASRGSAVGIRVTRGVCDLALGLALCLNAALAGAVLGELGAGALGRILPHAPLELAALGTAGAAYLAARRGELAPRAALARAAVCVALLAAGAVVESFVSGAL